MVGDKGIGFWVFDLDKVGMAIDGGLGVMEVEPNKEIMKNVKMNMMKVRMRVFFIGGRGGVGIGVNRGLGVVMGFEKWKR